MPAASDDLDRLQRVWWFPSVSALARAGTDSGTYWAFPLEEQPRLHPPDPGLQWLRQAPLVSEWAIGTTDVPLDSTIALDDLGSISAGVQLPTALTTLAEDPSLLQRLRSFTGCYVDLGDRLVPAAGGRVLLHFLSDQQWVRHWLVVLGADEPGRVVSTVHPLGFNLADDEADDKADDDPDDLPPPTEPIALDGSVDLSVAADSLEEFLLRFWIENEIAFRTTEGEPLDEQLTSYVAAINSGAVR